MFENPPIRLAMVMFGVVLLIGETARSAEQRVEVAADQTTTLIGTFDSLADVLADVCGKANVELRSYDAPDREVAIQQTGRPLSEVIERLLSQENFLLGVHGGGPANGPIRVTWVRVTGRKGSGATAMPGGTAVPSEFGATEFQRESPTDASRAQQAVAERLLADDARVALFLEAEPSELARSLRQYPHIELVLRKLRDEQRHPVVVEKLDAVIAELGEVDDPSSE